MNETPIREADKVEICSLVDNYSDMFLPDQDIVKRLRVLPPNGPLAEPGLSFLIFADNNDLMQARAKDSGKTFPFD